MPKLTISIMNANLLRKDGRVSQSDVDQQHALVDYTPPRLPTWLVTFLPKVEIRAGFRLTNPEYRAQGIL
jgi:hypothetical protein